MSAEINQQAIKNAISILENVLHRMDVEPAAGAITDLVEACKVIDDHYKMYCEEFDVDDDVPRGTTYNEGVNIEFYIEADWWHDVSLALRKLGVLDKE